LLQQKDNAFEPLWKCLDLINKCIICFNGNKNIISNRLIQKLSLYKNQKETQFFFSKIYEQIRIGKNNLILWIYLWTLIINSLFFPSSKFDHSIKLYLAKVDKANIHKNSLSSSWTTIFCLFKVFVLINSSFSFLSRIPFNSFSFMGLAFTRSYK